MIDYQKRRKISKVLVFMSIVSYGCSFLLLLLTSLFPVGSILFKVILVCVFISFVAGMVLAGKANMLGTSGCMEECWEPIPPEQLERIQQKIDARRAQLAEQLSEKHSTSDNDK